jgi:hypothetical protein
MNRRAAADQVRIEADLAQMTRMRGIDELNR